MDTLLVFDAPETHWLKILSVPLADRIERPARKAGFHNIFFWSRRDAWPAAWSDQLMVLSPGVLLSDRTWKRLRRESLSGSSFSLFGQREGFALVRVEDARLFTELLKECSGYSDLVDQLRRSLPLRSLTLQRRDWIHFKGPENLAAVERWLLEGLVKDEEGYMSRHFERKISLAVTRRLADTRVTPNQMTLFSTALGALGALFFIPGQKWYDICGALLFWLHSVLDGCDGEIARLKFLESRSGGILDFWGDNVVHSLVFACLALGLARSGADGTALILGFVAVGGTLLSAGFVYRHTMATKREAGPLFTSVAAREDRSAVEKAADFLARRDFIYLVIALACLGWTDLFLWMGAVGSPAYFLVILWTHLRAKAAADKDLNLNPEEPTT